MSARLRVLIVGCGNIAGGFDDGRGEAWPTTHAGAFARDGRFTIAACVDPNAARRAAFQSTWRVGEAFTSLDDVTGAFDVVSICSPTAAHADQIRSALGLRPRLVFAEKPVTPFLAETTAVVEACEAARCLLAVNHTRRWAPDVARLARELAAGEWGAVRSLSALYNKGVLNNGAHLVDLLHMLVGPVDLVAAGRARYDYWPDDPTVPALLETQTGVPVVIAVGDARDYAVFELTLVTERGVITMEAGGLGWRVRRPEESARFPGYRVLDAGERIAGEYERAMSAAVANIHAAIADGAPLASTGRSALAAQAVCERIKMSASI
jgi:predicted dehydrogenase